MESKKKLTPSQENYLEWIYRLSGDGPVRARDLAEKLGVRLPSVSRAVAGLVQTGLVRHQSYGRIDLTAEGRRAGEEILRRGACLTRLLVKVLGMDPAVADPEVHRMEHVLGPEVLFRLEILVEFALSSEAWIKRLHHRIQIKKEAQRSPECRYDIGADRIHAGSARKKQLK